MKKPLNRFRSICFPEEKDLLNHPGDVGKDTRTAFLDEYHRELEKCSPREAWAGDAHLRAVPYPVLCNKAHQRQLAELSEALVLAVTDIVERWWSDPEARFPERMPLQPVEEKLLRWMQDLEPGLLRPFGTCQGIWRPDFLLESSDDPEQIENFRICEINARFCWNGLLFTTFGQQALLDMGIENYGLKGATEPNTILTELNSLFDASIPLHLIKGEEKGIDIHLFALYAQRCLGIDVKFVPPENLRLVPAAAYGGYKLYCLATEDTLQPTIINDAGERLEEIHQLEVELLQRELLTMSFEMLQQISLRCFNDLRSILLVHDKRMLGIIREELDCLVSRGVLSSNQAGVLDRGLAHTVLPGSEKLEQFIAKCQESKTIKDSYLLKPIRSGKGAGILFGDQVSQDEWMSLLQGMRFPLERGETAYVLQKLIQQRTYDVLLIEELGVRSCHLIGTFHISDGMFLGIGIWRSGPGRISAVSNGGAWMCSVIQQ